MQCCAYHLLSPSRALHLCCRFCVSQVQATEAAGSSGASAEGQHALPVRKYLDSTVVPTLLQGLSKLSTERCVFAPFHARFRTHCMALSGHTQACKPPGILGAVLVGGPQAGTVG